MTRGEFIAAAIAAMPDQPGGTCSTVELVEVIKRDHDLPERTIFNLLGKMAPEELRAYATRSTETRTYMGKQIRPWIWHQKKEGVEPPTVSVTSDRPNQLDRIEAKIDQLLKGR